MLKLTSLERQVLEKLLRIGDTDLAAQELGLKPSTVYVIKSRIRLKVEAAEDFLKEVKHYRKVLGRRLN
jgi:DNA-binding CsgD family transcriptional regulator